MEDELKSYSREPYLFQARKDGQVVSCYLGNKYYTANEFNPGMIAEAEKLERDLKHARDRVEGKI